MRETGTEKERERVRFNVNTSKVPSIHKADDIDDIDNSRPISVVPVILKIIKIAEKLYLNLLNII